MDSWLAKRQYIRNLAYVLASITGPQLAGFLNDEDLRTDAGQPYQGRRGTYTLVSSTYKWLYDQGLVEDAEKVAQVFVKPDGKHAWD